MMEALLLAAGFHWLNARARGRGHRGPWWGTLGIVAYIVLAMAIHAPIMSWVRSAEPVVTDWRGEVQPTPDSLSVRVLDALLPGLLAFVCAFALVALVIPRAAGRPLGAAARASVDFGVVGIALMFLGVLPLTIVILLAGAEPGWALQVAGVAPTLAVGGYMLVDAGRYARYLGARNQLPSAEELLAIDRRRPVVFLRAFGIDERRARVGGRMMTLEEVLGPSIHWHVGPFIAVGNPGDYIAAGGAAKSYQADQDWQAYVHTMVQRASAVVVAEGSTAGLRWELGLLRQTVDPRRVFFVTIPRSDGRASASWPVFSAALRESGFEPPAGEVAPGSVLGCDAEWRLEVVPPVGPDLGTLLASRVPEATVAQGLPPEAVLPLIQRQGAPLPFARSTWRYVAMAFAARLLVLLVALAGASGRR